MLGERFDEVLTAAKAGDVDAFADVWRTTQPMLVRYLRVVAGEEADDLASLTWLRVMESLASFTGTEPQFRRWVVTVARHLHIDGVRRSSRRPETPVDEFEELADAGAANRDAAEEVEERISTATALRLISELPPAQAEMVMLRVVIGLEVSEVADIVGKRPGAVRVAVHRALRTLETRLSRPVEGPDVTQQPGPTFSGHDA